jgi:HK97 family phage major capsid protein
LIPRLHTLVFKAEPAPSSGDIAAVEEVKGLVVELQTAVAEMRTEASDADRQTNEKVEAIKVDLEAKLEEAVTPINRRSFAVDDERVAAELPELRRGGTVLSLAARLEHMQTAPPKAAAIWSRRPEADVRQFQEAADNVVFLQSVLGFQAHQNGTTYDVRKSDYFAEGYLPALHAAMDSTTAAEGDEFVPLELSGSLIERVNLALRVFSLFPSMDMPTQPFDVPAYPVSRQRAGSSAEATADTGQTKFKVLTPATRKITLDAKKFAGRILVSRELEEDAIIAMLPWIQGELVDYMVADLEDAVNNGDTTGTHMDYDTTAADDPRKLFVGLRKSAQAGQKTDASAAALTVAMLRKNRKLMGKYGITPSDLVNIVSINSYIDLLSDVNVITLDKYGPQATILTGELGSLDSVPLIVSEYQRIDLNATGTNDQTAANNTKTVAETVYRKGFLTGSRRGLSVQVLKEIYAESDQDLVIASQRKALSPAFPIATEPTTALHYNVLK